VIPNELSQQFTTIEGRRKLIELYGDENDMYSGHNEEGEMVYVSFDTQNGIVLKTFQSNGWVRVNYFDNEGYVTGETFDGRWDK